MVDKMLFLYIPINICDVMLKHGNESADVIKLVHEYVTKAKIKMAAKIQHGHRK